MGNSPGGGANPLASIPGIGQFFSSGSGNPLSALNPFGNMSKTLKIIFWIIVALLVVGMVVKILTLFRRPPQFQQQY